jgi:hypothetical protein
MHFPQFQGKLRRNRMLLAACIVFISNSFLCVAHCDSPAPIHTPAGVRSAHQPYNFKGVCEKESGIQDTALKSTLILSTDPRNSSGDSLTLFIDRNTIGTVSNKGTYRIRVLPGKHFIIFNLSGYYYIDRVDFVPFWTMQVTVTLPPAAKDTQFLSATTIPDNGQSIYSPNPSICGTSLFFGNGNFLMNPQIFKKLTSLYFSGEKVIDMTVPQYDLPNYGSPMPRTPDFHPGPLPFPGR